MAGASRDAWRRMDAATRVPMLIKRDGTPGWRAGRVVALCALPGLAFAASLLLFVASRSLQVAGDEALILFGVRATLAAVFPLLHLRRLKAAMATLAAEGALKS
jgi:hypothetical protein